MRCSITGYLLTRRRWAELCDCSYPINAADHHSTYLNTRGHLYVGESWISEAVAKWKAGRVHAERWPRIRQGRIWIAATLWDLAFVISLLACLIYCSTIYFADGSIKLSTDTVIEGKSIVTGVRTPGTPWSPSGLSVLNVQVRDARIEPIQAGSVPPALKGLTGQHLPYLGQSDGTLVLYDPTGAEVVYVPRGFVLLNVQVI
jgi:hypothetical protein